MSGAQEILVLLWLDSVPIKVVWLGDSVGPATRAAPSLSKDQPKSERGPLA